MPGSKHDYILATACDLPPGVRKGYRLIHVPGLALKANAWTILQEMNAGILECLKLFI